MKFILSGLGSWYRSWKLIEEAVPLAGELGFWAVVMPDHYMWGEHFGRGIQQPHSTLDTWVVLSYLAAKTSRVMLGTLMTPIRATKLLMYLTAFLIFPYPRHLIPFSALRNSQSLPLCVPRCKFNGATEHHLS